MTETFSMGKIVNTHGVKGEMKIYPYTDDPLKIKALQYILIEGEGETKHQVAAVREHKGMLLLKLQGYDDIAEIMRFMQKEIYVFRKDVEAIDDEDGHYIVDLIGCEIKTTDGEVIGVVNDVLQHTAQDLYEVKGHDGALFYIPVVDAFVKDIDVAGKCITVQMIEGLMP
ncbi:16S rRNA processing protein RimM [Fusibacter paucivorans]|uniref:Ribosome maturation factor RimM n=1 Tax=Fusibacter paucivorans TaxID=76009 RepID=A0ABS5PQY7_9FIRM|nr:ribosome maturation factor RimM [Fusibacter paucivorans]MBS7527471.1 16S rRNA processing protein RimM [Fusibacter paucivorans]